MATKIFVILPVKDLNNPKNFLQDLAFHSMNNLRKIKPHVW